MYNYLNLANWLALKRAHWFVRRSKSFKSHSGGRVAFGMTDRNAGQGVQNMPLVEVEHGQIPKQLASVLNSMSLPIAQNNSQKDVGTRSRPRTLNLLPEPSILRLPLA